MTQGIVKWFCIDKGYGFIEPEEPHGSSDIFVHLTAVERSGYDALEKGQKVSFMLEDDPRKGRKSITSVKILEA